MTSSRAILARNKGLDLSLEMSGKVEAMLLGLSNE